ncbi:MAG: protease inhibitor I42 family protein [Methanobacterium sp. ERen5]|nr:MAG: protease inhibitor I42 family protein [Methanobacterium sp. ERen5]
MKKLAILFATFVCFAMISGSFAATNQQTEKVISPIQYHKFVIIVPNNPTTGSQWRSIFDHAMVKLVSKKYVPDKANLKGPVVGYGGYDVYTFSGKIGQKITLKHVDPSGKVFEKRNYWIE